MNVKTVKSLFVATVLVMTSMPGYLMASSHMDAPLITLDPAANTTDVYVFRSEQNGIQYLTAAVSVYPFEEPGIGPNNYSFDDNVRYEIHLSLGDDANSGRKTVSYQFEFDTKFKNAQTILQSYLGVLNGDTDESGFDVNQNLRQTYRVTKVMHRNPRKKRNHYLGSGMVSPNNQGLVTPLYNQDNNGENPAKEGVSNPDDLDRYTRGAIISLDDGFQAFAGQRDDGFFADIQSVFDLDFGFGGLNKPFDSQGGYNVHTIAVNIPLHHLDDLGDIVGVHATTSRRQVQILRKRGDVAFGKFVQVGRQGNPLFNEALVAIEDKDRYNRTSPVVDRALFKDYALRPELARVLGLPSEDRQDIAAIFIPDLIRVDVSTDPVALSGDTDFHRLSIFGGDTLVNRNGDAVPGGFPNGRRFGDDVLDIALIALGPNVFTGADVNIDRVTENDISYNRTFPYAGTPQNGRNHSHH